jgi:hypothetical protein
MARSDAHTATAQSPVTKYLTWSSDEKGFKVFDKKAEGKSVIKLPIKFIHYDEFATIKGWDENNKTGIYSNEVKNTKQETLTVRTKNRVIAEGFYQDIKPVVNTAGGDYNVSLYAELNGEIVNFALKASALGAWSNFSAENRKKFLKNYVTVVGSKEEKKGAVKYHIPVFEIGDAIEESVSATSDKKYDELAAYFKERSANANSATEEANATQHESILTPPQESSIPAFDEPADTSELPF